MIPPGHHAEFVAGLADVLEVYRCPDDPPRPVIGLDEQPTPLSGATRTPLPVQPGPAQRYDSAYARSGTANHFIIVAPVAGWRQVSVRPTTTALDLAQEIKALLDVDYPRTEKVVLGWDSLNTPAPASRYRAFPPQEARRLLDRWEVHDTPQHGSWLDIAESELSVFTPPCLDRRIDDIDTLRGEAKAGADRRKASRAVADWPFTTDHARIKLNRLYP